MAESFQRALELIDEANSRDAHRESGPEGPSPKELLYARRMTDALHALSPTPSEALQLAVRAQHLERWTIAREDYPEGKAGYHRWRTDLAKHHANRAGELLVQAGYDSEFAARVGKIIRKQGLHTDPEVQRLEDCACLVFLEHYLGEFAAKHPAEQVAEILRKTWKKMSEAAKKRALSLSLRPDLRELVQRALG